MLPTSEKLRGHIGSGLSVCPSVRNTLWQLGNSRPAYARTLKFCMWYVHENKQTRIFVLHRSCHSGVMPLFELYINNIVYIISEELFQLGC